jgi:probable O-glycosylation ligase (exosortase A-associated)
VTGGGYQVDLGLIRGNSGLAEGSTLANLAIASIPIFIYMHKHNTFFSNRRFSFCLFYGLSAASVIASIGTFERTGLVSLAVLAVLLVPTLKHKFVYTTFLGVALLTSGYILSDKWMARMHTIGTYQSDDSAMTRIQVWSWTADYIRTHPLGGGFDLYRIDRITLPNPNGNHLDPSDTIEQVGRAFHSMWFEVLGEQGIPGLAIFLAMIATFYSSMMRTFRRARLDERLTWARSLSHYMMISLTTYLIGGSFIGIAFQPFLYDMLAAGIVLHGCVYRAMRAPRIESPAMAPGSLVTA